MLTTGINETTCGETSRRTCATLTSFAIQATGVGIAFVAAHDLHARVAATEDFEPGVDYDSSATSWCTAGDGQFACEQCHYQQSSRWTRDAAGENSPIGCLDR